MSTEIVLDIITQRFNDIEKQMEKEIVSLCQELMILNNSGSQTYVWIDFFTQLYIDAGLTAFNARNVVISQIKNIAVQSIAEFTYIRT